MHRFEPKATGASARPSSSWHRVGVSALLLAALAAGVAHLTIKVGPPDWDEVCTSLGLRHVGAATESVSRVTRAAAPPFPIQTTQSPSAL